MKLVFENSGDCLNIEQNVLYEYFVESVNNEECNSFYCNSDTFDRVNDLSTQLLNNIRLVDKFLVSKLKMNTFTDFVDCDLLNQHNLNVIHERWVKLQITHSKICTLMDTVGLLDDFSKINDNIHLLESGWQFVYQNYDKNVWTVANKFDTDVLNFNKNHISVAFHNLGRSSYNKWKYYDNNIEDIDTNDFTYISGQLQIHLGHPETLSAPVEYIQWCKQHNRKPIGSTLNLGNFRHDISELRTIFLKNESNKFFLEV